MIALARRLAPLFGVVTFLVLWEAFVVAFHVKSYKLPRPSDVVREVARSWPLLWRESMSSIWVMLAGLVIAMVIAGGAAVLLAHSPVAERALAPIAVFVQVTPLYAYGAAIVLWVGLGVRSLITMIAIVCFPPLLMNLTSGLRDVDANALELLRSVDASRWEVLRHLRVPSAVPQFFSALKVSSGLALVGVAIGEPFAFVSHGIGLFLRRAAVAGPEATSQLWACIFMIGLIGSGAYLLVSAAERVALRRHGRAPTSP